MTDNTTTNAAAQTAVLTMDPLQLLAKDRVLAEKAWHRLSLPEQVRMVLRVGSEQRLALCELSEHPAALVRALPSEELWFTLQELGGDDALTLLHHSSAEQIQFCFDVECWSKDRWLAEPTFEWLRLIATGGIAKIEQFFSEIDQEFLGLLLKQWVTVYIRLGDEDIGDAIPWPREAAPQTLDGLYFFQVADEKIEQWLAPMIMTFGKQQPGEMRRLLHALIGLLPSEQEELAYEQRGRRLAESGFPEWDEAIAVYRRVRSDQYDQLPRRLIPKQTDDDAPLPPGGFALAAIAHESLLLRDAIDRLASDALRDAVALELARLANRVVLADSHPISAETLHAALHKAIAFANVGLTLRAGDNAELAANLLTAEWLTNFFQIGFSAVMQLGEQTRAWWAAHPGLEVPDDPSLWSAERLERIRAASWKWPKYYVGPHSPDGVLHRDFRTAGELRAVEEAMKGEGRGTTAP